MSDAGRIPPALHLVGRVVLDDERELDEAWVVDGRLRLARPAGSLGEVRRIEGVAVPGLVDVHCHVGLDSQGAVGPEVAEQQALRDRDSGVLLIRDAGSPSDTSWIHDRPDLPRLIRSGRHLARPKRYLRHFADELAQPEDLPGAVAREAERSDGWVKIVADWIDRSLGERGDLTPLWPDGVLARAVAAAHARGVRVTAHCFATEAVPGLLAAGVDCLEHGTGLTPEQIEQVARRGIAVTPTLLQVARFEEIAAQADGKYPVYAARMRRMHARRHRHVRDLFEAGVRLLVGTDAGGTLGHGLIAHECAELVRAGVPDAVVVRSASWDARAYLGLPALDEGVEADRVVFSADPRRDVRVLAEPRAVVLRGAVVRG